MNIMGTYSGMDMAMVEQLIQAEASRGVKFTQKKEEYTQSKNAWKDLNTRLDSLYKRADDLQKTDTYDSKSVKLSNDNNLSVSASSETATGEYRVQVKRLATQTQLTGAKVSTDSIYTELNTSGTLEFNGGGEGLTVEVEETDSLRDISDKINSQAKETGIRSSIVDNRLILTNNEFGIKPLEVSGQETLVTRLGLSTATLKDGQNAEFSVNGLDIEPRSTNTIDDVIEGLTFNLTNIHEGTDATIVTVSENMDKAADTLQKFVDQYNSTQKFITSQLDVGDPSVEDNKTGTLAGDGTVMRLQSSLRRLMTKVAPGDSAVRSLKDLGVEVDREGTATFDRKKLEEQIKADPNAVSDFFSKTETIPEKTVDGKVIPETERVAFAKDIRGFVNEYISSSSGIIKTRNDTYDRMIKDVNDRISKFEDRLEVKKQRYIKQFTALDTAMMQAESQLEQMYSQLGMGQE